jgi:metal-sulfur cluster biosynthetic enzyme
MSDTSNLEQQIIQRLRQVIDPETQVDVVRMRLVQDLQVSEDGRVSYTVRPSSPLCPIAVFLAMQIKGAVAQVPGVTAQHITIKDYIAAKELNELINTEF